MNEEPKPPEAKPNGKKLSIPPGLVAAVLLVVALIFFVVQNGDDVAFEWLVFDMTGPLWVVILVAAVGGAVLNEVFGFVRRRRRRRRCSHGIPGRFHPRRRVANCEHSRADPHRAGVRSGHPVGLHRAGTHGPLTR